MSTYVTFIIDCVVSWSICRIILQQQISYISLYNTVLYYTDDPSYSRNI